MRLTFRWQTIVTLFTLATLIYAIRTKQSHGRFLNVPFEFRVPNVQRLRDRWWNPQDDRIFTPHVFGVGWSVNVRQVLMRLGFFENGSELDSVALDSVAPDSKHERQG